jgi:hypothetical protein
MFHPMQVYRDGKRMGRAESLEAVARQSRQEHGRLFEVYRNYEKIAVYSAGEKLVR